MAKKQTEERRLHRQVAQGEHNSVLISRLLPWCRHLRIEFLGGGMIAEVTGLPVGRIGIHCPHAKSSYEAFDLEGTMLQFLRENCAGCPHHSEIASDNAARELLTRANTADRETAERRTDAEAARTALNTALTAKVREARNRADSVAESVLALLDTLADEERGFAAEQALIQAARSTPESFLPETQQVLAFYAVDERAGRCCLTCLRLIAEAQQRVRTDVIEAARRALVNPTLADESAALLGVAVACGSLAPSVGDVAALIGVQDHHTDLIGVAQRRNYPEASAALRALCRAGFDIVVDVFRRRLAVDDRDVRLDTVGALRPLLVDFPPIAELLTRPLLTSLAFEDSQFGYSADVETCRALAEIYSGAPDPTEAAMAEALEGADEEVQTLIVDVYARLVQELYSAKEKGEEVPVPPGLCSRVASRLLGLVSDASRYADVRRECAETLSRLARRQPAALAASLDILLGIIAMLADEEERAAEQPAEGNPLGALGVRFDVNDRALIANHLIEALNQLAESEPDRLLAAVSEMIPRLNTKRPGQEVLKARLVSLLGPLGQKHATALAVLPVLWEPLMDVSSVKVRASAVRAAAEMLETSARALPENMLSMVVLALNDQFHAIHEAAVLAAEEMYPESEAEASEIARRLKVLFDARADAPRFQATIVRVLSRLAGRPHGLEAEICVLRCALKLSKSDDVEAANDALLELRNLIEKSEPTRQELVRSIVRHLARQDLGDDYPFSDPRVLFSGLFDEALATLQAAAPDLADAARTCARGRLWWAHRFCALLFFAERYSEAAAALEAIKTALPDTRGTEDTRRFIDSLAALASAEVKIAAGHGGEALKHLDHACNNLPRLPQDSE